MIDLAALMSDPATGTAVLIGALVSGIVSGAIAVALTLMYGR